MEQVNSDLLLQSPPEESPSILGVDKIVSPIEQVLKM